MTQRPALSWDHTLELVFRLFGGAVLGVVLGLALYLALNGLWFIGLIAIVAFVLFVGFHIAGDWVIERVFRFFSIREGGVKPARVKAVQPWLVAYGFAIATGAATVASLIYFFVSGDLDP